MLALVGRELCLYLQVDASKVPPKQRPGFVALATRRAAPFADPDFDVLWLQDQAAVWYWSQERARSLAGTGSNIRYRAEALFVGTLPLGDAEQLLVYPPDPAADPGIAGMEARIWRHGRLLATRWWAQAPDAMAWQAFARSAGLDASHPRPEPTIEFLREHPLSATRRRQLDGQIATRMPLIAGVIAGLCLLLLTWQAAGVLRAQWEGHRVEGRIAQLSARLETIISAREKADQAKVRIDALLRLRTPASQTRLLGEIKRLTPGAWEMLSWSQSSPEILEVTLKTANPDTAAIVAAWEASPLLQEVALATGNRPGELTVQAKLTPLQALAP